MMSRFFRLASLALGIAASGLAPASANGFVVGFVITPAGPAFTELADAYGKKHPGTTIKILPASSKIIIDNLNRDLSDDFVVLGQQWTGNAPRLSDPERVMTTRTIIVLAPGAKGKIASPADLAAHGIRLGNGSAGSGTEALMNATLDRLGAKYGGDFEARAKANIVFTRVQNTQLTAALKDDKIDATIIYPADADNAGLDTLDLGDASVPVTEVGAIVKGSANAATVKDFFAFVRSPQGEAILKRHHFDP
jgi:molybdate transport system substrate-binding protein